MKLAAYVPKSTHGDESTDTTPVRAHFVRSGRLRPIEVREVGGVLQFGIVEMNAIAGKPLLVQHWFAEKLSRGGCKRWIDPERSEVLA